MQTGALPGQADRGWKRAWELPSLCTRSPTTALQEAAGSGQAHRPPHTTRRPPRGGFKSIMPGLGAPGALAAATLRRPCGELRGRGGSVRISQGPGMAWAAALACIGRAQTPLLTPSQSPPCWVAHLARALLRGRRGRRGPSGRGSCGAPPPNPIMTSPAREWESLAVSTQGSPGDQAPQGVEPVHAAHHRDRLPSIPRVRLAPTMSPRQSPKSACDSSVTSVKPFRVCDLLSPERCRMCMGVFRWSARFCETRHPFPRGVGWGDPPATKAREGGQAPDEIRLPPLDSPPPVRTGWHRPEHKAHLGIPGPQKTSKKM